MVCGQVLLRCLGQRPHEIDGLGGEVTVNVLEEGSLSFSHFIRNTGSPAEGCPQLTCRSADF